MFRSSLLKVPPCCKSCELFFMQNIHFDDFKQALIIIEDEEEKEEGQEEEEQVDTTPWAGSDRDYSYEEVRTLELA